VTNEWASKTIDKTVQHRVSLNGAQAGEGHSVGLAQSEEFDCPSRNFIGLKHGTKVSDYLVEAIAFQSGRRWSNGRSWMNARSNRTPKRSMQDQSPKRSKTPAQEAFETLAFLWGGLTVGAFFGWQYNVPVIRPVV
jgi:hypothetical protein